MAHGCRVGGAAAATTTMRIGSLAPRRLAFAALANAAAFATVGGTDQRTRSSLSPSMR